MKNSFSATNPRHLHPGQVYANSHESFNHARKFEEFAAKIFSVVKRFGKLTQISTSQKW